MTKPTTVDNTATYPKRFYRSVRLESDIEDINNLTGYSLTNHVLHVLGRMEEGLHGDSGERAWTLTGPYGSGKSAFALFLAKLISNEGQDKSNLAYDLLKKKDPKLAMHYNSYASERGLCPVALTLRSAPLSQSILEGLIHSLQKERQTSRIKKLILEIRSDLMDGQLNSQLIIHRLDKFIELLPPKYRGAILILDELGKALEYASRYSGDDVYLLQELAEYAARSRDRICLIIGILHQAFEQYGEYLDQTSRLEWAKVQGRFSDIAFIEPPEQQIRLAVQAIASLKIEPDPGSEVSLTKGVIKIFESGFVPNGLKRDEITKIAIDAYPLHITSVIALPYLFKRFAQNQRSLFAYLLSSEPCGLQEQIANDKNKIIRLPDLFDYFSINISGGIAKQLYSKRWYEIKDALERIPGLSLDEVRVLKTIGLLDMLGETGYMLSKSEFIGLALHDEPDNNIVNKCLESLQKKSLIVHRRYNETYKIWEGSDVDIDARLEEGHRKNQSSRLSEDLLSYLPNKPMVARRHSYDVGAMRFFEIQYVDSITQANRILQQETMDGKVVCCLPGSISQIDALTNWIENEETAAFKNILFVVPQQIGTLYEAASELRSIHWVWQNTPELRDDRIARRELAERTALFEGLLNQAVQKLFDPRPEPYGSGAYWYYLGHKQEKAKSLRDVSELLSKVMDNIYSKSPKIKNELINRRSISSAASAARRNIVERMLANENEPFLGIEGFPPERSIYESILKVSDLHHYSEPYWRLPAKKADPLNLTPAFRYMDNVIFSSLETQYSLERLLQELTMPPYGVMPGVFPVLLVAFILSHPDEISLYRDGVFVPVPNIADFEVLMRRPELFAVAGSHLQGERLFVVERISKSLKVQPKTLSVTRAIINMVRHLPDHAWRTRHLSKSVSNLRAVIEQAKSPERLLFIDIPKALDEPPFMGGTTLDQDRIERFFNKLNSTLQEWSSVTQDRISQAGKVLIKACNLPASNEGWRELIEIAQQLNEKPLNDSLRPFVKRLTIDNELEVVIESVLALVANRPPRSWTDKEVSEFPSFAKQIGDQFVIASQQFKILTPSEELACNELIEQIKLHIREDTSSHIKKVALARLLQEIE